MQKGKTDLVKAIKKAASIGEEGEMLHLARAIVLSIDESNYTAKVVKCEDEDEPEKAVYTASLRGSVLTEGVGIILVPEIESKIVIGFVNNSEQQAVMIQCSKVSKIIYKVKTKVEIETEKGDKIIIENGIKIIPSNGCFLELGSSPSQLINNLPSCIMSGGAHSTSMDTKA